MRLSGHVTFSGEKKNAQRIPKTGRETTEFGDTDIEER
jgi:hypothetical protein